MNIRKHKIDFADVPGMFNNPMLVDIDERAEYDEVRFIGIGRLRNIIAVVIFTEPEAETIRIISARKALKHERNKYEQKDRD
jgi:uncharacterized DUF497 family protein